MNFIHYLNYYLNIDMFFLISFSCIIFFLWFIIFIIMYVNNWISIFNKNNQD
jgi:hypothetical protein